MNIHKDKMLWYNTRYCIRVSYEKKRLLYKKEKEEDFRNFNRMGRICVPVSKRNTSQEGMKLKTLQMLPGHSNIGITMSL